MWVGLTSAIEGFCSWKRNRSNRRIRGTCSVQGSVTVRIVVGVIRATHVGRANLGNWVVLFLETQPQQSTYPRYL